MFLIGGGEIGTEIAIAALNDGWFVRVVVDERETEPIVNLPFYPPLYKAGEKLPRRDDLSATCVMPDFTTPFLFIPVKRPYGVSSLANCICRYRPNVVILEDPFLSHETWKRLHAEVLGSMNEQTPFFIPSPIEKPEVLKDIPQSDIFLSKLAMKKFLYEIGLGENLLGSAEDTVHIADLRVELKNGVHGDQLRKIDDALRKHNGRVIFKLDQTSSGHGQFVLSKIEDLTLALIDQQLRIQERSHRARNKFFVMERYVADKLESCAIEVRKPSNQRVFLNRIYYKKYGEDREKEERFHGIARLAWSFTEPKGRIDLWDELRRIVGEISRNLTVPFLYVEFILDFGDSCSEPGIYINEICYRPDDAGFISRISHEESQFFLFVKSLDELIDAKRLDHDEKTSPILEPAGSYSCETLIPGEIVQFDPSLRKKLTYDYPPETRTKSWPRFRLRLYEKILGSGEAKVTYGRIVGYIWHLTEEDGRELLRTYQEHKKISEETIRRLIDALPKRADEDLAKGLSFAKGGDFK